MRAKRSLSKGDGNELQPAAVVIDGFQCVPHLLNTLKRLAANVRDTSENHHIRRHAEPAREFTAEFNRQAAHLAGSRTAHH